MFLIKFTQCKAHEERGKKYQVRPDTPIPREVTLSDLFDPPLLDSDRTWRARTAGVVVTTAQYVTTLRCCWPQLAPRNVASLSWPRPSTGMASLQASAAQLQCSEAEGWRQASPSRVRPALRQRLAPPTHPPAHHRLETEAMTPDLQKAQKIE